MGVLYTKVVDGPAEIGVWEIGETVEELYSQVKLSDHEESIFHSFSTESRIKQWLAYRRLIREIISPQEYPVHYDDAGKPYLAGSNWHISVTHTGEFAGVIISKEHKVGIDMERIRPRIDKIKEKFLSEEELSRIPHDQWLEQITLAWCAKETLYKLYGYRNLDFRKNIRVQLPGSENQEFFTGEIMLSSSRFHYDIYFERKDDLFVVWAVDGARTKALRS